MTIEKAIAEANSLSNNLIDPALKREWLSRLDGRIYYEILHPSADEKEFKGYTPDTDPDTELLVGYPWDSLYVTYLEMECARVSADGARFANARMTFNETYNSFLKWHNRTNVTESPKIDIPIRRY